MFPERVERPAAGVRKVRTLYSRGGEGTNVFHFMSASQRIIQLKVFACFSLLFSFFYGQITQQNVTTF